MPIDTPVAHCAWWPGAAELKRLWAAQSSRRKRITLIASGWAMLHLLVLGMAILFAAEFTPDELRGWSDVVAYHDAGSAFRARTTLYELTAWEDPMTYYYHPAFAMVASWVVDLPFRVLAFGWFMLQVAAYLAALAVWYCVLRELRLDDLARAYVRWLPLALVFTEWIVNLVYGNLTSTLLLLSGMLTLLLLRRRAGWASLVALPILLVKPQWLFPLIVPVVLRRWRLLVTTLGLLALAYGLVNGLFLLVVGWDYGLDMLRDYATFLTSVNSNYVWGGHTYAFENFNHSWRQILISYGGDQAWVPALTAVIQLGMAIPLGLLVVRLWRTPHSIERHPQLLLWVVGLAYLVAMALLAQLWEIMGSIVFFLALQGIFQRTTRRITWIYLLYALYELPAIVGFLTGWSWLILPQSIPLTMIALVLLYSVLFALARRDLVTMCDSQEGISA